MEFQTTLLREKFIIRDARSEGAPAAPIMAVSNRMVINLPLPATASGDKSIETFIIRAQTMHSCVRMAAKMLQTYEMDGPLQGRAHQYDWASAWDVALEEHERQFHPDRWVAVYHKGEILYQSGQHNGFLDVIESCEAKNRGRYEQSQKMAEAAFAKLGKIVTIAYDGGIALVMNLNNRTCRCGLMVRAPEKKTSFNFMSDSRTEDPISAAQCLLTAANYLEGVQLAYTIGAANEKAHLEIIPRYGPQMQEADSALRRMGKLQNAIKMFEQAYQVRYRPEPPNFERLIKDAEDFTRYFYELKLAAAKEQAAQDQKSQDQAAKE